MSAHAGVKKVKITGFTRRGSVPVERPVTVYVNDQEVMTVQATPEHLDELAAGFVFTEGMVSKRADIEKISADTRKGLVWITAPAADVSDVVYKKRYITSGCGKGVTYSSLGHARGLKPISSAFSVPAPHVREMMRQLTTGAVMYRESGGLHSSALADASHLLLLREDVGRHSTIDKIIGRMFLDEIEPSDKFVMTTGRISYEMVVKVAKMRVPMAISLTAATDLAIEIANKLNICLIGYSRGTKMSVYTAPYRITDLSWEDDGS